MKTLLKRSSALFLLLLACGLFCASFAACGSPRNPDVCFIEPPTGYPTFTTVNGTVYIHSGRSDSLYALRATDGAVLWKFPALTLMAVEQNLVFVEGTNDVFYALNASDGSVRWKYDMGKDTSGANAVVDGLAYFSSSASLTMYTLRASDGTRVWQQKIDVDHFPSTILAQRGVVYVAAEYGRITAYRESDGFKLWQDEAGNEPPGYPLKMTLGDGVVYATSNQTVALRASDGTTLWHFSGTGQLIAGRGVAYLSADNGFLYALRASDGAQFWRWQFPTSSQGSQYEPYTRYTLTLANNVIYAGLNGGIRAYGLNNAPIATYTGHLYTLKSNDGTLLWSHPLTQPHVALSASDATVYTLAPGALDAWQASSGKQLWHVSLQQIGLMIDGSTLYAGSAGQTGDCFAHTPTKLTALQATSGAQLWQFQDNGVQQ
jgi:outer membrane protein assembly factor BamB